MGCVGWAFFRDEIETAMFAGQALAIKASGPNADSAGCIIGVGHAYQPPSFKVGAPTAPARARPFPSLGVVVSLDPVQFFLHESNVGLDFFEHVFGLGVLRLGLLHVRNDPIDLRLNLIQFVPEFAHVVFLKKTEGLG